LKCLSKLSSLKQKILSLPINSSFFCLIIDTHNDTCSDIWTEIFGYGGFRRISKINEEEVPQISSDFIDKVKGFLNDACKETNVENVFVKQIDFNEDEFNNYEISRIKIILETWYFAK
jgi:hypothetical protein